MQVMTQQDHEKILGAIKTRDERPPGSFPQNQTDIIAAYLVDPSTIDGRTGKLKLGATPAQLLEALETFTET